MASENAKRPRRTVTTPEGVSAFVYLVKPKQSDKKDKPPKYEQVLVFDKKADLSDLEDAINELAVEAFGDKALTLIEKGKIISPLKVCAEYELSSGDTMDSYGGPFAAKGARALSMSSYERPGIIDEDGNDLLSAKEVYSGMLSRASVNLVPYDAEGNRGIGCYVNSVLKTGDGEQLGGAPVDPRDAFGIKSKGSAKPKARRDADAEDEEPDEDDAPRARRPLGRR